MNLLPAGIGAAVGLLASVYMMLQVRKPSLWLGRLILKDMNRRHSEVTDWGLGHVEIREQRAIVDVGCGGGRTLEKLAALAPLAHIVGIDYAAGSIAESKARNAALIAAGRVEVVQASVDRLPGPAGQYDLATAVETLTTGRTSSRASRRFDACSGRAACWC
jgi:SAM-dependent methyltransferase